ncbi:hypothetical protein [Acinetobacter sp. SWAC57]|uniref:hypothetical protein n=1 Tax=Acinetobacter sp. SWAC57 TaxID=2293834 RepID=UPI000E5B788A|nr:hypothetical protein [Acinetobacter sp. SWAC57]RGD90569.1 hypothetical protein DYI96_10390 [Acinetobacter sp. SWAC57]
MGIDVQGYVGDPEGQPSANCKVFMFLRSDGSLLGSAVTDETGSYTMTHTGQVDDLVFIVCLDNDEVPDFEGLVYDRITLVDTPEIVVISCDGATSSLTIFPDLPYVTTDESDILWQVEIDGILYDESIGPAMAAVEGYNYMEGYLEPNQDTLGITGEAAIGLVITNISATDKRVRLIPDKAFSVESITLSGTPTVSIDESTGIISFCLAAVSA